MAGTNTLNCIDIKIAPNLWYKTCRIDKKHIQFMEYGLSLT